MLRFTHLRLRNWKNFREVDIDLAQRVFLVGPNASGKSNFLDVFRFLRDVAESGLRHAVDEKRPGIVGIRSFFARNQPRIEIEVRVTGPDLPVWTYLLALDQRRKGPKGRYRIVDERVTKDGEDVVPRRPTRDDDADEERLTQTYLEQVGENHPFRELVNFFRSVRYLHLVPQLVKNPDRWTAGRGDVFGGDFLVQLGATPERTRLARLDRIRSALAIAVPQLSQLNFFYDKAGIPHLDARFQFWRPNASKQSERQLSDGTLRLVGLFWSFLDGKAPLLLEEPELSLNASIVRQIPDILWRLGGRSGRQTLISTHSAELLSGDGIDASEILLVVPGSDGSRIDVAGDLAEVRRLLEAGVPLQDVVGALVEPKGVSALQREFDFS